MRRLPCSRPCGRSHRVPARCSPAPARLPGAASAWPISASPRRGSRSASRPVPPGRPGSRPCSAAGACWGPTPPPRPRAPSLPAGLPLRPAGGRRRGGRVALHGTGGVALRAGRQARGGRRARPRPPRPAGADRRAGHHRGRAALAGRPAAALRRDRRARPLPRRRHARAARARGPPDLVAWTAPGSRGARSRRARRDRGGCLPRPPPHRVRSR